MAVEDARMKGKKDGNYTTTTRFSEMFCPLAFRTEMGINILYSIIKLFHESGKDLSSVLA